MDKNQSWHLDNDFTYHAPRGQADIDRFARIREAGKEFARVILEEVPRSVEQGLAYEKVREAVMMANAGLACQPARDARSFTPLDGTE